MLEEANAQTGAIGGALDQARNIRHYEAFVAINADHTQVRDQGGKRIIRHLRFGGRHGANKGAFARIRQAQQTDVCQHFQFQLEVARLARLAQRGLSRRAVGTRFETGVAQTMPTTMGHQQALARLGQVANHFLSTRINHRGADWHAQHQLFTLAPRAIGTATIGATLGIKAAGIAIVDQGVEVLVGDHVHRAAIPPITTVRPTILDELLATETHATVAAITSFYKNRYFIDEFHGLRLPPQQRAE